MGQDPRILKCFVMHQVFAAPPGVVLLLPHCLSQEGTVSSGSTWPLPPNDSFSAGHRIKARVLPTLDCSPPSYTIRDQESDCRSAPGFAVTQNWARTLIYHCHWGQQQSFRSPGSRLCIQQSWKVFSQDTGTMVSSHISITLGKDQENNDGINRQ